MTLMFDAARHHVEAFVKEHGPRSIRTDRVTCFDATNRRIDGCVYLYFAAGADHPSLVAKVARTPAGRAVFDAEYANLVQLDRVGLNAGGRTIPDPLGRHEEGPYLITLQRALAGTLMKNVPGRRLFGPRTLQAEFERVFEWWERLHRCVGTRPVELTGDAYEREVLLPLRLYLRRFLVGKGERALLRRRFEEQRRLEGITLPFMVRHGDFCAANVVLQPRGLGVFDWEFPLEHKAPLFDLFHFFSSLRFPYEGWRGESSHFDSFLVVWWSSEPFSREVRALLRRTATNHGIPIECLDDLFLLTLVDIANMKYRSLLDSHGLEDDDRGAEPSDQDKREAWRRFDDADKAAPLALIRSGVFENLRAVAHRGTPGFLS